MVRDSLDCCRNVWRVNEAFVAGISSLVVDLLTMIGRRVSHGQVRKLHGGLGCMISLYIAGSNRSKTTPKRLENKLDIYIYSAQVEGKTARYFSPASSIKGRPLYLMSHIASQKVQMLPKPYRTCRNTSHTAPLTSQHRSLSSLPCRECS